MANGLVNTVITVITVNIALRLFMMHVKIAYSTVKSLCDL